MKLEIIPAVLATNSDVLDIGPLGRLAFDHSGIQRRYEQCTVNVSGGHADYQRGSHEHAADQQFKSQHL